MGPLSCRLVVLFANAIRLTIPLLYRPGVPSLGIAELPVDVTIIY
jgi:hypothetical protein